MPIKPVEKKLNTFDALYYQDLIYCFCKIGGLEYEPNQETEERIQARLNEKEEKIQLTIGGLSPEMPNATYYNISIFLTELASYVSMIFYSNNIPYSAVTNIDNLFSILKNYPEQVKQVITELEEKVRNLKINTKRHKRVRISTATTGFKW